MLLFSGDAKAWYTFTGAAVDVRLRFSRVNGLSKICMVGVEDLLIEDLDKDCDNGDRDSICRDQGRWLDWLIAP